MTQELSSESVNVDAFKIIKLATAKVENRRSDNGAYAIASAIEYVSIHDRPPLCCRTTKLRPSATDSELNRNLRHTRLGDALMADVSLTAIREPDAQGCPAITLSKDQTQS